MTTGKTIALTRRTFVGKVMSLLLNMLSRLVITFFPRSKRFLISWLQSPSAVILEPPKIKSDTVSTSISHEVMGPDTMILVFWMLSLSLSMLLIAKSCPNWNQYENLHHRFSLKIILDYTAFHSFNNKYFKSTEGMTWNSWNLCVGG